MMTRRMFLQYVASDVKAAKAAAEAKPRKLILLGLSSVLALSVLAGCKAGVTGQPTAPDLNTPYQKAASAMSGFASDVQSAQQVFINLHKGGVIDKPTDTAIQMQFKQISAYGKQIDALILAQASATTIQARVNATLAAMASITAQTGKVDAQTLQQIQAIMAPIQQILSTVLSAFNLTSEVTHGPVYNRSVGRAGGGTRLADLQPSTGSERSRSYLEAAGRDYRGSRRQVRRDCQGSRRGDRWRVV